jgi:TolB-like protein
MISLVPITCPSVCRAIVRLKIWQVRPLPFGLEWPPPPPGALTSRNRLQPAEPGARPRRAHEPPGELLTDRAMFQVEYRISTRAVDNEDCCVDGALRDMLRHQHGRAWKAEFAFRLETNAHAGLHNTCRVAVGVSGGQMSSNESDDGSNRLGQRLSSWKRIAAHVGRSERTVRRWENHENLPVHRLHHNKVSSVYAFVTELDAWLSQRSDHPIMHEQGHSTLAFQPLLDLSEHSDCGHICLGLTEHLSSRFCDGLSRPVEVLDWNREAATAGQGRAGDYCITGSVRTHQGARKVTLHLVRQFDGSILEHVDLFCGSDDVFEWEELVARAALDAFLPMLTGASDKGLGASTPT